MRVLSRSILCAFYLFWNCSGGCSMECCSLRPDMQCWIYSIMDYDYTWRITHVRVMLRSAYLPLQWFIPHASNDKKRKNKISLHTSTFINANGINLISSGSNIVGGERAPVGNSTTSAQLRYAYIHPALPSPPLNQCE